MNAVVIPTAELVVSVNEFICQEQGNPHHCYGVGKIESALHSALYPGAYPFTAGGLARVAGAMCFYLVKAHAFVDGNKRTGALVAVSFLNENGWDLRYAKSSSHNVFAEVIDKCAASEMSKDQLMDWFDAHKRKGQGRVIVARTRVTHSRPSSLRSGRLECVRQRGCVG